jgi:hypothetical protein
MIFYGIENQTIQLDILNLEYPRFLDSIGKNEDVFLMIFVKINCKFGHFEHTNPFLTIDELKYIIYWFRNLSRNKITKNKWIWTIEDYFKFELVNSEFDKIKIIKIYFYEKKYQSIEINHFVYV